MKTGKLALALLFAAGCVTGGGTSPAREQMRAGVAAAVAGLWQEAAFRFERARKLGGESADLLNNLAVAYEVLGRYEEALTTYKRALELAPQNRRIRRNYGRFAEFYAAYIRGIRPKGGRNENQ